RPGRRRGRDCGAGPLRPGHRRLPVHGRPEACCHRAMLDAIRHLVDNGTKWRAMPADFPPRDRVYAFSRRWRNRDLVREFHARFRRLVRERAGRDSEPGVGVIDSQSVRADAVVGSDSRGFDGGKLINGRKRHVVVDTLGLLLAVMVTAADVGDRAAAQVLLTQVAAAHHLLALVWADGGYADSLVEYCLAALALVLVIVKRSDDMRGFVVLPKRHPAESHHDRGQRQRCHPNIKGMGKLRYVVEQTSALLHQFKRLAVRWERRTELHDAFVSLACSLICWRRLNKSDS
ncbi:transposase, partial [Streptomyces sp. NPDC006544]|uniref:transposase n=1 Tax=Streptomyces sp. NPDC006544 TaxID=3154583 RepID=UPI0033A4D6FA